MYKLLDLFCGGGGCSMGYSQAGFKVIGIDIDNQANYPFKFIKADVMEILKDSDFIKQFDLIHASPPCQSYTTLNALHKQKKYVDLYEEVKNKLDKIGVNYIIENVKGSPVKNYIMLCGIMFGLRLFRHRYFESNLMLMQPEHIKHTELKLKAPKTSKEPGAGEVWSIYGHFSNIKEVRKVMGAEWMNQAQLSQAIPPSYTKYIGNQAIKLINNKN